MDNKDFINKIGDSFVPIKEETILSSLMRQYRRVIFESLITAFGLDELIIDQHGGDVDTVHSVRHIGIDPNMGYKNHENEKAYENRGDYSHTIVTGPGTRYEEMKHEARKAYGEDNRNTVIDAYEEKELHFLGNSNGRPIDKNANLDHVIPVKEIFDDRGRTLAGLSTEELANERDNLQWTNEHLNKSMKDDRINDYIEKHPELPENVRENLMQKDHQARDTYEMKVAKTYYTSPQFAKDFYTAAGKSATKMGLRQAVGFIMSEVVISVWNTIDQQMMEEEFDMPVFCGRIAEAIKNGFSIASQKYKVIFKKLSEGAISGALSSITTSISNIFSTTAKDTVRIIRQSSVSLVAAGEVLFINPNDYLLGEKLCETAKIIATGASVVAGTIVGEAINKSPAISLPLVGEAIQVFCSAFVTGTMSCTFLLYFDSSILVNKMVVQLNKASASKRLVRDLHKQSEEYELLVAEVLSLDVIPLRNDIARFRDSFSKYELAETEEVKNCALKELYLSMGMKLPWASYSSFEEFLADKETTFIFE